MMYAQYALPNFTQRLIDPHARYGSLEAFYGLCPHRHSSRSGTQQAAPVGTRNSAQCKIIRPRIRSMTEAPNADSFFANTLFSGTRHDVAIYSLLPDWKSFWEDSLLREGMPQEIGSAPARVFLRHPAWAIAYSNHDHASRRSSFYPKALLELACCYSTGVGIAASLDDAGCGDPLAFEIINRCLSCRCSEDAAHRCCTAVQYLDVIGWSGTGMIWRTSTKIQGIVRINN